MLTKSSQFAEATMVQGLQAQLSSAPLAGIQSPQKEEPEDQRIERKDQQFVTAGCQRQLSSDGFVNRKNKHMSIITKIKSAVAACLVILASGAQASLGVGDVAPDWTLQASDGKTYQLSDFRGKHVVLAFFPKAFTGGCTIECKSVRDSKRQVRRFDVEFFMASTDDLETNKAFAEQNNANFPILSDEAKDVSEAYGVLASMGFSKRWTFYIDASGKIAKIDKDVNPRTAGRDLLKSLVALQVPTSS